MSLLFQTNLKEYARQCAMQRQRYEGRKQQSMQHSFVSAETDIGQSNKDADCNESIAQTQPIDDTQQPISCIAELLEIHAEPSVGKEESLVWEEVRQDLAEELLSMGDRPHLSPLQAVDSTKTVARPAFYSAP